VAKCLKRKEDPQPRTIPHVDSREQVCITVYKSFGIENFSLGTTGYLSNLIFLYHAQPPHTSSISQINRTV
jgi:hypothetical protein